MLVKARETLREHGEKSSRGIAALGFPLGLGFFIGRRA
jgi:hypothetical protein